MDLKHRLGVYLLVFILSLCTANPVTFVGADIQAEANCSGTTPLHDAVLNGQPEDIDEIIQSGVDMYAVDCHGLSAMHLAIKVNKTDMIYQLVNNDFDLNYQFEKGDTVLFYGIRHSTVELVETLISLGSDVNIVNFEGVTPLLEAMLTDKPDFVSLLKKYNASYETKLADGDTLLHKAADSGNALLAITLIDKLNFTVDVWNHKNEQPLHRAVIKNHSAVINVLISRGAHVSDVHIFLAVKSNSTNALRTLLENGSSVNPDDKNDPTALRKSVEFDNLACAKLLVSYGADVNELSHGKYQKQNLLHYAAYFGSADFVPWLVDEGLDVNSKTIGYLMTPLHIASESDHVVVAKILLEKGATLTLKNSLGNTPVELATSPEMKQLFKEWMSKGNLK